MAESRTSAWRAAPWWAYAAWAGALSASACVQIAGIEKAQEIAGCASAAACDDGESCTDDACNDGGICTHAQLPDGPIAKQIKGDCHRDECQAGKALRVIDDLDAPDDMNACTNDVCDSGNVGHISAMVDAPCMQDGGTRCDGKGHCVECTADPQCTKPKETCGAVKPNQCGCKPIPCANVGLTCGFAPDDGCNHSLNCNDGTKNGGETDVDCGGPVSSCSVRCNTGKMCKAGSDCASGKCDAMLMTCQP